MIQSSRHQIPTGYEPGLTRTITTTASFVRGEYLYVVLIQPQRSQSTSAALTQNFTSATLDPLPKPLSQPKAKGEHRCKHYRGRHSSDKSWREHPENAPNWFKKKMKDMVKEKGDRGRLARNRLPVPKNKTGQSNVKRTVSLLQWQITNL